MDSFKKNNVDKNIVSDNIEDTLVDEIVKDDILDSDNGEKIAASNDAKSEIKTKQKQEPRIRSSAAMARDEELIPFAWRYPLVLGSQKKVTKVLKAITEAEKLRKSIVPVDER